MSDYKPTAAEVKELREATGAGMLEVRNALVEAGGDKDKARKILRERGAAKAAKLGARSAGQGAVGAYVHPGSQKGVLVEVRCETDFVASNDAFQAFVKDMLLQIVSSDGTQWITIDDVPADARENELGEFRSQAVAEGKSGDVVEKIAEGRLKKWFEEVVLLEQPYFRDEKLKVEDVRANLARETGENIQVARFTRYDVGGA